MLIATALAVVAFLLINAVEHRPGVSPVHQQTWSRRG